jgi:nickel-dependent lactate racemase
MTPLVRTAGQEKGEAMTTTTRPGADAAFGTDPGDPDLAAFVGGPGERLSEQQVTDFVTTALADADLDGASVCLVVPDGTRTCPLPLLLAAARGALTGRARQVTVVIALGTHQGMGEEQLARHLGFEAGNSEATYPGWRILNHESWLPETFTTLGTIGSERMAELTGGLMTDTSVDVRINRHVAEADVAVVIGPVFPHEVVGFSGGNKYFFPGVSGQELIDLSHWVGALITSAEMIGTRGVTPVRALVNEAAAMIPARRLALCLVVASGTDTLHAAAFGTPEDAWAACAAVSAETHVTYRDAPVRRVLSVMPTKYEDIWTAAKGFYKLEPIVADGGEVIIYAPHITQISVMHPQISEIGYHNRDYFLGQWDRFRSQPWGDLAHSTHLRGQGTWDPEHGERNRVTVTLATGIPEEVVRSVNLSYLDPTTVDVALYEADPDTFVEPHAGEVLYRLRRPGSSPGLGEPDGRTVPQTGLDG